MSDYDDKPWLARYNNQPADYDIPFANALEMYRAGVEARPDDPAIVYFDGTLTRRELDEQSDALAAGLLAQGFERGDRLAVYLQNVPQFVIAMVATWKAGGVMVSINPMSRVRELDYLLKDCGAKVLVCLESLYDTVAREVVPKTDVQLVLTTSELEYQSRNDERVFKGLERHGFDDTTDLAALIEQHRGEQPPAVEFGPDDVAFLTYTSGTTGVPKGAMNTHRNVVFTSQVYRDWMGHTADSSVLGIAPLFHITGLIGHIGLSLLTPMPLVLAYRFDAQVVLDAMREHRPTFTIGAITAFTALLNAPGFSQDDFSSFDVIYSGGAAISPTAEQAFKKATGLQVHNAYGLTETTSPMTVTPRDAASPVDPTSGALSVGVPAPNTIVRIQGDDGHDLPLGEIGEIVADGPQVVAGYWGKPDETAANLPGGALKSGDVGFMNPEGWVFIVDRKKDMINAAGYKVWPREVEDVLAEHDAVREAAVIGIPDEYRGETVKAYVSLKPNATTTPEELIAHCKERMAAYKYPRSLEIVDELPKTVTGKILRRELRDQAAAEGEHLMAGPEETIFTWGAPPLKFGPGASDEIGFDMAQFGVKRVLIVTDQGVARSGVAHRIADALTRYDITSEIFDGVHVEPTDDSLHKAAEYARQQGPWDGFVAVGGGSAIDTAKVVNLLTEQGGELMDYVNPPIGGGKAPTGLLKPLIAVPTTAGTGSESTAMCVMDILSMKVKTGISHWRLRPTMAVVDPLLTMSLPPEVTAASGMDIVCHALESYTARPYASYPAKTAEQRVTYCGANPVSDVWSERAMTLVASSFRRAVSHGAEDQSARSDMMLAATFAGMGFGNAGVHIPHANAYPIAGMVKDYRPAGYPQDEPMVPHGQSVSLTAPEAFRFSFPSAPERHLRAAELLAPGADAASEPSEQLPSVLVALMRDIGIPNGIGAVGYTEADVPDLVPGTMKQQRLLSTCPRDVTEDDIAAILTKSISNW